MGLLGRPALYGVDGPRALSGHRESGLLAVLAANADRTVSASQLEDELWEGRLVSDAALRVAVNRLRRKCLESIGTELVRSHPGGYRLDLGPVDLDVNVWEGLVQVAGAAHRAQRHGEALAAIDQGLELWRGDPYDGCAHLESVRPACSRLREARDSATEQRALLLCELGEHAAALGVLDELVVRQPLRESACSLRMVVLSRIDRPGEALVAYEALARALQAELGVSPSRTLRRLRCEVGEGRWVPLPSWPGGTRVECQVPTGSTQGQDRVAVMGSTLAQARRNDLWTLVCDALIARSRFGPPSSIPEALAEADDVDDALGRLAPSDSGRRGALLCWKAQLLVNVDGGASVQAADQAYALAYSLGASALKHAVALVRLRQAEARCDPPATCVLAAARLLEDVRASGATELVPQVATVLQGARLRAGDLEALRADQDPLSSAAGGSGGSTLALQLVRVGLASACEPMDTVDELSRRVTADPPPEQRQLAATARTLHLAVIRWEQGRLHELESVFVQSLVSSPRRLGRPLAAACRLEVGDVAGAGEHLAIFERELDDLSVDWAYLATLAIAAETCASVGFRQLAQRLDELLGAHGPQGVVGCSSLFYIGQLDRYRGLVAALLGDPSAAIGRFAAGRRADEASGARLWAAWSAHGEAESRLARSGAGDGEAARVLLANAALSAEAFGSRRLASRVKRTGVECA